MNWYSYADWWLNFPLGRFLDFGCGPGGLLERVHERCQSCTGVDVDPAVLAAAAEAVPSAQLRAVAADEPLPFDDNTFDTIAILEVIEHVRDERFVLDELCRVLKPGGRLLLTTPHRGLLTFLDPGNFKVIAPAIHRLIHRRVLRQQEYYENRFGERRKAEHGLVGDISADRVPWHRHYRYSQIRTLAPAALETLAWAVYFPAMRALSTCRLALKVVTLGRFNRLPPPFLYLYRAFSRRRTKLGDQLVVLFEKRA